MHHVFVCMYDKLSNLHMKLNIVPRKAKQNIVFFQSQLTPTYFIRSFFSIKQLFDSIKIYLSEIALFTILGLQHYLFCSWPAILTILFILKPIDTGNTPYKVWSSQNNHVSMCR